MTIQNSKCPKCGGELEEGFTISPGADKPLWGTKMGVAGWTFLENKKEVKTYRCKNCGYLESYAI